MLQQATDVTFTRSEVLYALDDWKLIDDCIAGQRAIKAGGTDYLPMPNPDDTSEQNLVRYAQYKKRAVFYNVTRRTHAGLTALAFVQEPTIVLPAALDPLLADVDGAGVSLQQQMQDVLGKVISHGRCGLCVDFPAVKGPISRADLQSSLGMRPTIRTYAPKQIINWRMQSVGSRCVLGLLVLAEAYEVAEGFGSTLKTQWRVLSLARDSDGKAECFATIYRNTYQGCIPVETHKMTGHGGEPLREIPFVAVGSRNNDINVDEAPMLALANMNVAHYCNSADYEESVFMCGQPTPVLTGMTKDWWEGVLEKKLRVGSRSTVPLPPGAALNLIAAAPNGLVREAMQDKERQMVALGARLIQTRDVQRTATEARIESASEMSVLGAGATNTAAGYVQALQWAGLFAGTDKPATVDIHAMSELEKLTPAEREQLIKEMQEGGISWTEYRTQLRRSGVATQDDKLAAAEIAASKQSTPVTQEQKGAEQ